VPWQPDLAAVVAAPDGRRYFVEARNRHGGRLHLFGFRVTLWETREWITTVRTSPGVGPVLQRDRIVGDERAATEHIEVLVERIATGDWQSSDDETRPQSRARRILDGLVFSGVLAAVLAFAIASVYLKRDYMGVADRDVVRTGLMIGGVLDMVIVLCVVWQTRTPTADGNAPAVRDPGPLGDD